MFASFQPAYLQPPEQQYRWRRIEHEDGVVRDWHSLLVPDDQWANLTPVERGWELYVNELGVYYWAAGLYDGQIEGMSPVRRVLAEWVGPIDSSPPMEPVDVAVAPQ